MRNPSMPRHVREADARTLAPSHDPALTEAADSLGLVALAADISTHPDCPPAMQERIAVLIAAESRRLAVVLRSLAGVAAVALLAAGLVVAPLGAPQAQAVEAPQPDPVAAAARAAVTTQVTGTVPSYRVVLDRSSSTIRVAVTAYATNVVGQHCAEVRLVSAAVSVGASILARGCSRSPWFSLSVPVTAAKFGAGGTYRLAVVDDLAGAVTGSATLTVLRPSRIAGSYIADGLGGQLFVAVALQHYQAASRTWTASQYSPIRVQIMHGRTWRTIATVSTDARGYAGGYLWTGPGRFLVRLLRPEGATVTGVTGVARFVDVSAITGYID